MENVQQYAHFIIEIPTRRILKRPSACPKDTEGIVNFT